jgi:hypothetical protein
VEVLHRPLIMPEHGRMEGTDAAVVEWLLEGGEPSVRYAVLTRLLGGNDGDLEVDAARQAIMTTGAVPAILGAQGEDGHWAGRDRFYTAKYTGTVWQLLVLAELGADGDDERVRRGCEAILRDSQDADSGAFSVSRAKKAGGGLPGGVIPCLTGNMLWSLLRLGRADDPRVRHGVEWLTTFSRFDDGDGPAPTGWPYEPYEICWGRHTCFMGVVKSLKALAEIPEDLRSSEVRRTVAEATEFLLRHHVFKRSHDLAKVSKPGWRRFGFPLMYQTDVLEILGILAKLNVRDARLDEAVDLVAGKRDDRGRWALETTFNERLIVGIEGAGQPSRWITLRALEVLGTYAGNSRS